MKITDRDITILREVGRWQITLGRHIKELAAFSGGRACDNRLKILVENKYLAREKALYGTPYIYSLTHKSRMLLGLNKRAQKIKLDQIRHDIKVLDVVVSFIKTKGLRPAAFTSEREMHRADGFTARSHRPDFIYTENERKTAVEIELSIKEFDRLEDNVKTNYLTYDNQLWIIEESSKKIRANLLDLREKYPNVSLMYLEDMGI
jgi:hypothetical protein